MKDKKRYPNKEFRKLVKFINDGREDKTKKIYEDKEPREINWNAYTISQINEAKEILLFIKKEKIFKLFIAKLRMGKKGLSPVVATLLLVVVVVSLSSVVFIWARGFIGEAIQKNGEPVEQACEGINLVASYYASDSRLQISNNGDISVSKLSVSIESGGDFSEELKEVTVLAGDSVDITIASGGTKVEIIPWITGEKSGDVKEYYECENMVVRADII